MKQVHQLLKSGLAVLVTMGSMQIFSLSAGAQVLEWKWFESGGLDNEQAHIVVDGAENSYVAYTHWNGSNYDFRTIKYNSVGTTQWIADYNGTANGWDMVNDIALDGQGNVYVTGRSANATDDDYATVKYNAGGVQQWVQIYDGTGGNDEAVALATDYDDSTGMNYVYVVGHSYDNVGLIYDYALLKYTSAGVLIWERRSTRGAGYNNYAMDLAISSTHQPVFCGRAAGATNDDYAIIKYSPTGIPLWQTYYDYSGGDDIPSTIACEPAGPILVTGYSYGGAATGYDYATLKLSGAGTILWAARFNGAGNGSDFATDLALDGSGHVIVTGRSVSAGGDMDYATVKYDAMGVPSWFAFYDNPVGAEQGGQSVAVDASANVYVAGWSDHGATNDDYDIVKYDGTTGAQLWAVSDDFEGQADLPYDLVVDNDLNVYATGIARDSSLTGGCGTLKYDQGAPPPNVTVFLAPLTLPVQVPSAGGSFPYTVMHTNNTTTPQTYNYWIMVEVTTSGAWVGPIAPSPFTITLPPMASVTRVRSQAVNAGIPAGTYVYEGRVGNYPGAVWDRSNFTFEKTAVPGPNGHGFAGNWENFGSLSDEGDIVPKVSMPAEVALHAARPNPFNPSTTIDYQLSTDSQVQLRVFDTTGRLVADLVNGWREAGSHEATFNASNLPSGIYVARLEANGQNATEKLVLIK